LRYEASATREVLPVDDLPLYRVTATPWAHGWELDVEGLGVTQTYTEDRVVEPLDGHASILQRAIAESEQMYRNESAEEMVREYITLVTGQPEGSFRVHIDYPDDDYDSGSDVGRPKPRARRWPDVRAEAAPHLDERRVAEEIAQMRREVEEWRDDGDEDPPTGG
jgi:hypothetical protein